VLPKEIPEIVCELNLAVGVSIPFISYYGAAKGKFIFLF
jgi:hypothetical protein